MIYDASGGGIKSRRLLQARELAKAKGVPSEWMQQGILST
jgi:hypothetical protein